MCDYFTKQGAAQFAATVAANSCAEAITALSKQVTAASAYSNPEGATVTNTAAGTEVNACTLTWISYGQGAVTAGPQLGHFTLTHPDTSTPGYLINGVQPC